MGRGEYTEKRLSGLIKMTALEQGESSHTHRIRASQAVNEWFKELTAEQRGALITSLYDAQTGATPVKKTPTPPQSKAGKTSATPVKQPRQRVRKLTGQAQRLYDLLLMYDGAELVQAGTRYEVRHLGELLGSFAGATAGALLTRESLLKPLSAGVWTLNRAGETGQER